MWTAKTLWMPRLIRVFAGRTLTLMVLSCRGSILIQENMSIAVCLIICNIYHSIILTVSGLRQRFKQELSSLFYRPHVDETGSDSQDSNVDPYETDNHVYAEPENI